MGAVSALKEIKHVILRRRLESRCSNKRKEFIADVNSRFSCMGFCTHEGSVVSPEDMTGTAT